MAVIEGMYWYRNRYGGRVRELTDSTGCSYQEAKTAIAVADAFADHSEDWFHLYISTDRKFQFGFSGFKLN